MKTQRVPVSCNRDCGAGCPLIAEIRDGRILSISDNPVRGRFMRGCIRGYHASRLVESPQRLTVPLIRTGPRGSGEYRETSWEEALDLVAERFMSIRADHGAASTMHIGGSGSCRGVMHNTNGLTRRFLTLAGGYTRHEGSYSSAAERFVNPFLFGTNAVGMDAENLLSSKLVILWGANISDTRFGCDVEEVLLALKRKRIPIIVVDPRRSRTAKRLATEWYPIYPGTDTAAMLAVLYVLLRDGLMDRGFIDRYCSGFSELEGYVLGDYDGIAKTPSWASALCGLDSEKIETLARLYAELKPAALIPGLSIQRTVGGEEAIRAAVALQAATGNIGVPGGSSGSSIWGRLPGPKIGSMADAPLPGGLDCDIQRIPVYRWPDAVLEGRKGGFPSDTRILYVVGGNYLATGSDVAKNIRAFLKAEFTVCHDLFLTPTAGYCDVVLPSTSFLEREDVVTTAGNFLCYSSQAVAPVGQSRNDFDIFAALAERMGFLREFAHGMGAGQWIDHLIDESEIPDGEEFKRTGIYYGVDRARVAFTRFVADPETERLATPSGKIEISSSRYAKTGYPAFPSFRPFQPSTEYPLYLISPHARYRVNSQNSNDRWFARRQKSTLLLSTEDAASRGIRDGGRVLVSNDRGSIEIEASVSTDIVAGVVCIDAGAWPDPSTGAIDSGGCANVLTSTEPTLPSNGSRTHSTAVQVRAAERLELRRPR